MTTIAWDGAVLAADNGCWTGSLVMRALKVRPAVIQKEKLIVAVCGGAAWADAALDWLEGRTKHAPIGRDYDNDLLPGSIWGIAVNAAGEAWDLRGNLTRAKIYDPFASAGAGREIALGALAAGATAIQAVGIAAKYTDFAKHGVTAMRFNAAGDIELAN